MSWNEVKSIFLLAMCGLLITSCTSSLTRPQDKLLRKLMAQSARAIAKEMGIEPIGTGCAAMTDIKEIDLIFQAEKTVYAEEATDMIMKCAKLLLEAVNSDEKIRPYLSNYPYTSKNINVSIIFTDGDPKTRFVPEEFIASATVGYGKLMLDRFNPKTKQLDTVLTCPYNEVAKKTLLITPLTTSIK